MKILLIGILVTEIIKYGIWFKGIDNLKLRRLWLGGLIAFVFTALILKGLVDENTPLIVWTTISLIIYGLVLEAVIKDRISALLKGAFIVICFGEAMGKAAQLILGVSIHTFVMGKKYYIIDNIIAIIIFIYFYFIKRKVSIQEDNKSKKIYDIIIYFSIFIIGLFLFITISGIDYIARYIPQKGLGDFIKIISIISFLSIICLNLILTYIIKENKIYKKYLENDKLLINTQKSLYDAMLAKNKATIDFRHDIQNHLICMNELARGGNVSKVKDYIESMQEKVQIIQSKAYSVNNDVIDAVLNYYIAMLEEDVNISVEGECRGDILVGNVELCTISSNIIKNAVEALENLKKPDKYLYVNIIDNRNYLILRVKNSMLDSGIVLDRKDGMPLTTKNERDKHGIGLRNVKETVEKSGGIFNIDIENMEFSVTIMLPFIE